MKWQDNVTTTTPGGMPPTEAGKTSMQVNGLGHANAEGVHARVARIMPPGEVMAVSRTTEMVQGLGMRATTTKLTSPETKDVKETQGNIWTEQTIAPTEAHRPTTTSNATTTVTTAEVTRTTGTEAIALTEAINGTNVREIKTTLRRTETPGTNATIVSPMIATTTIVVTTDVRSNKAATMTTVSVTPDVTDETIVRTTATDKAMAITQG